MELIDIAVIAAILLVLGVAAWYLYKSKKSGQKCVGCPYSSTCAGKQGGCCGGNLPKSK